MITSSRTAIRTLFILSLAVLVTACVGGPPKPMVDYQNDYNFTAVKKIAFYRDSGQVSGDNPMQLSDMQRDRIDRAMKAAIASRGFEIVQHERDADLLVSWHLVTQHQTDVRQTGGYGYGGGYGGYYGRGYGAGYYGGYSPYSCGYGYGGLGGSDIYSYNYTKGKFIVDMIDPSRDRSVWRGITESRLKKKPQEDQTQYDAAATVIFAAFPPA